MSLNPTYELRNNMLTSFADLAICSWSFKDATSIFFGRLRWVTGDGLSVLAHAPWLGLFCALLLEHAKDSSGGKKAEKRPNATLYVNAQSPTQLTTPYSHCISGACFVWGVSIVGWGDFGYGRRGKSLDMEKGVGGDHCCISGAVFSHD